MTMRWRVVLAALLTGIGMAGAGLGAWRRRAPRGGHDGPDRRWARICRRENPYRGQPDYALAQKIGAKGFNQNCARCHGLGAVSGGIAPDLRLLVPVDDDGYFIGRVMSGSIRDGVTYMPPFEGGPQPGGDLGDPLLARHRGPAAVKLSRRAALAGLAALIVPVPARARIYADTVNTVGESLDQIRAKDRLRIGVYADFAPFSAASASGLAGHRRRDRPAHCRALGVRLELVVDRGRRDASTTTCATMSGAAPWSTTRWSNLMLHVPYSRELEIRSELAVLVQPYYTETFVIARDPDQVSDGDEPDLEALGGPADRGRAGQPARLLSGLDPGRAPARRDRPLPAAGGRRWPRCCAGEIAAFMGLRSQIEAGLGDQAGRFDLGPIPLAGASPDQLGRGGGGARERARSRLCGRRHPGRRGARRHHRRDLRSPRDQLPAAAVRLAVAAPSLRPFSSLPELCRSDLLGTTTTGRSLMTAITSTDRHCPRAAGDGLAAGAGRHRPGPAQRRPDHRATS